MTIELPRPGDPRRPHGPRDPGDAWVVAPSGQRYWGRFGAAGLMAVDPDRGIVLQHRAAWSHHGDTWGLPGGARHAAESARHAAPAQPEPGSGLLGMRERVAVYGGSLEARAGPAGGFELVATLPLEPA